jgi:hypothetical protein
MFIYHLGDEYTQRWSQSTDIISPHSHEQQQGRQVCYCTKEIRILGHNKEKLVDFSPEFEHTALQSFKMPCIYKWVSKSSALTATKVLKLKSFKIKVVLDLQPFDSINRVNSCNRILRYVYDAKIHWHEIFF